MTRVVSCYTSAASINVDCNQKAIILFLGQLTDANRLKRRVNKGNYKFKVALNGKGFHANTLI